MFAVPGFSVGNLVVEGSKEQLKKRKADVISTPTPAVSIPSTTANATTSSSNPNSAAAILPIAPSTSNAPFSKKFKKEPTFEKRPPSEPKLGWGWLPEPVPLKERATWNQSTKAMRKARAEEEKAKKAKEIEDKKQLVNSISGPSNAVDLLLKGSVDLTDIASLGGKNKGDKENKEGHDIEMKDATGATPKKRNKRLERKIKRAAYIAAMEASNKTDGPTTITPATIVVNTKKSTIENSREEDAGNEDDEKNDESTDGKKKKEKKPKILQAPTPKHPELAKLTNKEKRLLKQLQKKQQAEGIDPTSAVRQQNTTEESDASKDKKSKKPSKNVTTAVTQETKPTESEKPKKEKKEKIDSTASKKQQQLTKEREKLLEALARTNSALEQLQDSLGDGDEDATPLAKKDVKSVIQDKKKKNKQEVVASSTPTKKEKKAAVEASEVPAASKSVPAPAAKQPKLTKLQEQMKKTLAGGKFRFLNEQLYTTTGEEAFELFQSKPELFDEYHEGFRSQVESWPQNPVDIFISQLKSMPKDTVIADLGCGDAQISAELPKHKVLSFDLVAKNGRVTACDIAHLPLEDASVDVAIFCLSLMGTDFLKFLKEAYRVLKPNGKLKISEVISRFTDVDAFVDALKALGFELKDSDSSNKMFIMFDFVKPNPTALASKKSGKKGNKKQKSTADAVDPSTVDIEALNGPSLLKPCIYKKR